MGANAVQQGFTFNVRAEDHRLRFQPTGLPAGPTTPPYAYAVFSFDLSEYSGPQSISLEWEAELAAAPGAADYFIGLGNFSADRWDWFGGAEIADGGIQPDNFADYVSAQDRLVVAVVLTAETEPLLTAVTVGNRWVLGEVDLTKMYAPPTPAELTSVEDYRASRNPAEQDYVVEYQDYDEDGFHTLIISYTVDELTLYGTARIPPWGSKDRFAILVYGHGGSAGSTINDFSFLDLLINDDEVRDNYILVVPTFRGEPLYAFDQGIFYSESGSAVADSDADDALALVDCIVNHFSEADEDRIIAMGISRGSRMAQTAALRNYGVAGVVDFYGLTDYWVPSAQTSLATSLEAALGGEDQGTTIAQLLDGSITVWDYRAALAMASPAYFAEQMPQIQIHHGVLDPLVSIEHGDRLAGILASLPEANYVYYRYAEGTHNTGTLPGCGVFLRDFLLGYLDVD
ncbi:dienelactone hydrolase family protein [bacterium]|nr:dienelactone hydrolase family protein [bacterium]